MMVTSSYRGISSRLVVVIYLVIRFPTAFPTFSRLNIPDRPSRAYVRLADINLGGLFAISDAQKSQCGTKLRVPILQQMIEAVVFAVEKVNRNKTLLPNVKLGFALLDECAKESTAAAQSLRFLPRIPHGNAWKQSSLGQGLDEYYDVVGIIGPLRSSNSIAVSHVLGPAHVPQVSFLSTSDVLSRKNVHPYFLRVVPPDAYQMQSILKFISLQGWSFFSVLYSAGSYGEPAYEVIKNMAPRLGLCIAAQHKLYRDKPTSYYNNIIQNMIDNHKTVRVVLLVSGDNQMVNIFRAVHDLKAEGRFIWIGTDGWAERVSSLNSTYRNSSLGSFTTTFYAPPAEEFIAYFRNLKPSKSNNPWFTDFWERMFNCSFRLKTCNESVDITTSPDYTVISQAVYGIDAVYAYAHALHRLLADTCPNVTGYVARNCVKGSLLLEYLKNVSFHGLTGFVDFDKQGDRMGKYVIRQIVPGETIQQKEAVVVDVKNVCRIKIINNPTWEYVKPLKNDFGPNARFPRTKLQLIDNRYDDTPISVCSRLCEHGEEIIQREPSCCWTCRRCRENERLVLNHTRCQQCPKYHWPDAKTSLTTCSPIDPTYPEISDPIVIIIICLSVIGMISTIVVLISYVVNRSARVIKASSRELSFFQLGAIFFGYLTMMVYVMRPSDMLCVTSYFLFSLSFNWLYAPLLIKTIRIYRIFKSANKGIRALKAVSPFSQLAFALAIILGQIIICAVVSVMSQPQTRLTCISKTEKYVELSCDLTNPGLLSFIAYNFSVVCLCTIFAFKTRKLPDNFNESRFISMCVFTTLVLWLGIVPSFVTASREYLRSLLLAIALLLNHSVALIFLFVSRIYAVYYVDDICSEHGACGTNASVFPTRTHNSATPTPINTISNSNNFLTPGTSYNL